MHFLKVGVVDFNMLQTVLHCLAQQLRVLGKNVELKGSITLPIGRDNTQTIAISEYVVDTEDKDKVIKIILEFANNFFHVPQPQAMMLFSLEVSKTNAFTRKSTITARTPNIFNKLPFRQYIIIIYCQIQHQVLYHTGTLARIKRGKSSSEFRKVIY